MALFFRYLAGKWRTFGLLALFALIFAVVFSLYDLPVEAVGYAALLCLACGAAALLIRFFQFRRDHRVLTGLTGRMAGLAGELPRPGTPLEADYRELVTALYRAHIAAREAEAVARRDLLDYYTLWVHQVKTPISAMGLVLQETDHPDGVELSEQLTKIERYVDMVLQYLKLETPDFVIRRQPLDPIIRGTIRKFSRTFIRRGIGLDYAGTEALVLTDARWLGFAIEQILSNALKYTKAGKISLYLHDTRPDTLVIRDIGVGIRPEDLPRVTEKGFTGLNGRAEGRGTGIGLYLTRRMLERLGHTLAITSVPGQGTTVCIGMDTVELPAE